MNKNKIPDNKVNLLNKNKIKNNEIIDNFTNNNIIIFEDEKSNNNKKNKYLFFTIIFIFYNILVFYFYTNPLMKKCKETQINNNSSCRKVWICNEENFCDFFDTCSNLKCNSIERYIISTLVVNSMFSLLFFIVIGIVINIYFKCKN
jgi:hypothetical protein